jgi:hypothetical protein
MFNPSAIVLTAFSRLVAMGIQNKTHKRFKGLILSLPSVNMRCTPRGATARLWQVDIRPNVATCMYRAACGPQSCRYALERDRSYRAFILIGAID